MHMKLSKLKLVSLQLVLLLGCLPLTCLPSLAQEDDMAYAVATTWEDTNGTTWAYLLWQATQANRLKSGHFAIYEKLGDASSASAYQPVGFAKLETNPGIIQGHLNDASYFGEDLGKLEADIDEMFEGLIDLGGPLSLGEKLASVIAGAMSDDELYQRLLFLGRVHPGVNLALGLAFAKTIEHTGLATFEVREYDPVRERDLNVIGRLTVDAGAPAMPLPAPGDLFEVPREDGQGHLNVRLRWATPDALRRVSLLQYGFNVYRITKTFAESNGFHLAPPLTQDLVDLTVAMPEEVARVNRTPVLSTNDYDNASVITAPNDDFFLVDDNNRFYGGVPFQACDRYYYFTTALDILGRDGDVSPGLQVTICDRLPPTVPKNVHVENYYSYNSTTQTSDQRLKVIWNQNDEDDPNAASSKYYIYRWSKSEESLAFENDPVMNRIAEVNHIPGEDENSYIDNVGPTAPAMPGDANKTYWYTVRAVDINDCVGCKANVSGNSAPGYGVLRDRVGPDGTTGTIEIMCGQADVDFTGSKDSSYQTHGYPVPREFYIPNLMSQVIAEDNCPDSPLTFSQNPAPGTPVSSGVYPVTITVTDASGNSSKCEVNVDLHEPSDPKARYRLKATQTGGIAWAEFYLGDPQSGGIFLGRVTFQKGDTSRYLNYTVNRDQPANGQFVIFCRVSNEFGQVSDFAQGPSGGFPPSGQLRELCFTASMSSARVEATDDCNTHLPVLPGSNVIEPVTGTFIATATTREWKLYRRIDNGELSMIDQGTGKFTLNQLIAWVDDAMPANNAQVCYFVQLLDEHGNASPMSRIGCIQVFGSASLGAPMMISLEPAGDLTSPQMTINWFGEKENVDRFQVYIASDPSPLADPLSDLLSPNDSPSPNMLSVSIGPDTFDADFGVFRTPRLGGSRFSDVPMYQVTIPVDPGATYTVMVRAADANNRVSDLSNALQFVFPEHAGAPPIPVNNVPWPARSQPPITNAGFDGRVIARQLQLANGFNGIGIRIGDVPIFGLHCMSGGEGSPYFLPSFVDPIEHLYFSDNLPEKHILPIALYRYQVPNANFPEVSGDLIQVSPLIEQIAYHYGLSPQFYQYGSLLEDPFIAVTPIGPDFQSQPCSAQMPDLRGNYTYTDCFGDDLSIVQEPAPGTFVRFGSVPVTITATDRFGNQSTVQTTHYLQPPPYTNPVTYEIFALDTQPVVVGASYRYLLVRFKANHEIDQVIPVDEIEVRSAL